LGLIELELPVVHDPTHWRIRRRRNLDEVEVEVPSDQQGFGKRLDTQLAPVGVDESDFTGTDSVVDTVLNRAWRGDLASLLYVGHGVLLRTDTWSGNGRNTSQIPDRPVAPSTRKGGGRVEVSVNN